MRAQPKPLLAAALAAAAIAAAAAARAEDDWLRLQTPRFGVVSQLDEGTTRRWAVEFDQFIDTLQRVFAVDDSALPPLTIVLFENQRAFNPYRPRNAQGEQADIVGFFANRGTWSVIGIPSKGSEEMRLTVYHEAVHWFLSADPTERPVWFEEGLAETFSTFEIKGKKARLGLPARVNLDYLQYTGMRPLEELIGATRDEAHARAGYYPQAWAFVHYLLFGNNGELRGKLTEFLRLQRETDVDTAFTTAFGVPYRGMTNDLRAYVDRGRYFVTEVDVADRSAEMSVSAAAPAAVEFALARLAAAGNNDELARRHLDAVVARAPNAAPVYELRAQLAQKADDRAALGADLDRAIELGSTDAIVYAMKASLLLEQHVHPTAPFYEALDAGVARTIADLFSRSIELTARSSKNVYEGYVRALANVGAATERDDATLARGRLAFPSDGFVLAGQAIVEQLRGNLPEASRLVRRARSEPFTLTGNQRRAVNDLHMSWFVDLVSGVQNRPGPEKTAEIAALLAEQLADPSLAEGQRRRFERLETDFRGLVRLNDVRAALDRGRRDEARAILTELAADEAGSSFARREAERLLEQLSAAPR